MFVSLLQIHEVNISFSFCAFMWMQEVMDFTILHQCTLRGLDGFKSLKTKLKSAKINIGCFIETSTCRTFPLEDAPQKNMSPKLHPL